MSLLRTLSLGLGLVGILGFITPVAAASLSEHRDVREVALGQAHTCALSRAGSVSCWGNNEFGELGLGDNSQTLRSTPVPVRGLGPDVRGIAAGYFHSCAIVADGAVKCWGRNFGGALGNGTTDNAVAPVDVLGGLHVTSLRAGVQHTCALTEAGGVKCWGDNSAGQLGDGSLTQRLAPVDVVGLGSGVIAIAAGAQHSCAILANGSIRCWGANGSAQLGDGSRTDRSTPVTVQGLNGSAVSISGAALHSCAVSSSGGVFCWGELNLEGDENPDAVRALGPVPGLQSGYVAVASGVFHSCALNQQGGIRCFGFNDLGQFGSGTLEASFAARETVGLEPNVLRVGAGGDHSCAVAQSGNLQCWGRNNHGQLGIDRTSERLVRTQVEGLDANVVSIGAGSFHGCALTANGAVKCWGDNTQAQLGDGTQQAHYVAANVTGLQSGVRQLAVGFDHACVITEARRAMCWGANHDGRLGNGSLLGGEVPVAVQGLDDNDVIGLAQGRAHGCALLLGGTVRCWGDNQFGQVGDGSTEARLSAVPVSALGAGVRSISAGDFHACAVTQAGGLKCWGVNDHGQLGDGSFTSRASPVDVQGLLTGVQSVSAGNVHTCAVMINGSVRCWGAGFFGLLLGDDTEPDRAVPGPVPALASSVSDISVGGFASCARGDNGGLRCWGSNSSGTLGDNTTQARGMPGPVAGLNRGVSAFDVGFGGQACAVVLGRAFCWGENTFGQVGDGTTYGVPVPQLVLTNELSRRIAPVTPPANAAIASAKLDALGRVVAFQTRASNLVEGDTNNSIDVFRVDRESGNIRRVSVDNGGAQIGGDSIEPTISGDGRLIAFVAADAAVAAVRGESKAARELRRKGGGFSVYLHSIATSSTQRVGAAMAGGVGTAPQIAPASTAIVFTATNQDPEQGLVGQDNVFTVPLLPVGNELVPAEPRCVSCKVVDSNGVETTVNSDGASTAPVVSSDGTRIAYQTQAKNALGEAPGTGCPAGTAAVILRDMASGAVQRVSPAPTSAASGCGSIGSTAPSIDYSGTQVAFQSDQVLDPEDQNELLDVFHFDTVAADVERVSIGPAGGDATGGSSAPSISGDGKQVVFVSSASNLDISFADNNGVADVHTANLENSDVSRLSLAPSGAEANAPSAAPVLNFDGSRLAFDSAASAFAGVASQGSSALLQRSNPLAPARRSATWWVEAESGWGLTVFDQGNVLVPAWFTYDTDGEPTWFLVGGALLQPDGSYRGDLFRLTGTRFDQIEGPATTGSALLGSTVLRYRGESTLEFEYPVPGGGTQIKRLDRFPFGARTYVCAASPLTDRSSAPNLSDIWTGTGSSPGWGLTLFHIDNALFGAWYTYDLDGEAVFNVFATTRQNDGSFSGPMVRQRNGTPFSQIDGSPPSPAADVVGTARFTFSGGSAGVFSYTVGAVTQNKPIVRLLVGDQATSCSTESIP